MPVYDDQEIKKEQGSHDNLGVSAEDRKTEIADLENNFNAPPADEPDYGGTPDRNELKSGEEDEAESDESDALGKGYSGSDNGGFITRRFKGKSKAKKRLAIAGILSGGSLVAGVLIFLALLPMKIEFVIQNIEGKTMAAANQAIGNETENLFAKYVQTRVIPILGAKNCHTTIDPGCIAKKSGAGPVSRLYNGWRDNHLERKLASSYGIVIGKKGTGVNSGYVLSLNGKDFDFNGKQSIFDIGSASTRTEIRSAVKNALEKETLFKRTYLRFKVGKFLERKYGVTRCLFACSTRDKIGGSVSDKKLAAKALLIRKIMPEKYGIIVQCIMAHDECSTKQEDAEKGETSKDSKLQKKIQAQLIAYAQARADKKLIELMAKVDESGVNVSQETIEKLAQKLGDKDVEALLKMADDISKKGFTAVIVGKAVESVAAKLGASATAEAAGKTATEAVPVVGWVLLAANVVAIGSTLGTIAQYAGYASNVATSVELYQSYATAASEYKSGNTDATMLGYLNDTLSTNMSGSTNDQVPMTEAPTYKDIMGDSSDYMASIFGVASAASSTPSSSYICNNNHPVPSGQKVCDEEHFDQDGSKIAENISSFFNAIPGLSSVAEFVSSLASWITKPIGWLVSQIPGIDSAIDSISHALGIDELLSFINDHLIVPATSDNMSGARTFDLMVAGADASNNCQETLGCPATDSRTIGAIEDDYEAEQRDQFNSMSIFARMFDTSSPYSLISKVSLGLPPSTISRMRNLGGMFLNPLSIIFKSSANIFSPKQALAANDTVSNRDPFGIKYNAYSSSEIPSDPESFWKDNCVDGPLGWSNPNDTTGASLDISTWLNNDKNASQDPNTGETIYHKSNQCLLIRSTIQSAGAMFDNGLATAGAQ